jgi:hypothetical protein
MQGDSDAFVRIAFCKTDDTIDEAATALSRLTDVAANGEEAEILVDEMNIR